MKLCLVLVGMAALGPLAALGQGLLQVQKVPGRDGKIVVANRASGTLSVIDVATDKVIRTVELPPAENPAQPMYVSYGYPAGRVFVGDRGNDRVVVLAAGDLTPLGSIPAGRGVFHQWQSPPSTQLWVNNDVDNTVTVIDAVTLATLATVPLPEDLVALGGRPHDVIVDPNAPFAFVSMLAVAGGNDYVVQFSTETFTETARAAVGLDPHLSLAMGPGPLLVACQNTNEVIAFDRTTLTELDRTDVPGAHGVAMNLTGSVFYTTNLPGGGIDALFTLDPATLAQIGDPVDTPYPIAHNLALTPDGTKLYVTHSGGASDKVTVFRIGGDLRPVYEGEITVGFNPFGLAFVP